MPPAAKVPPEPRVRTSVWFFTPDWLAGEREADGEIAAGRGNAHESAEDMFAHLDALGSDDD